MKFLLKCVRKEISRFLLLYIVIVFSSHAQRNDSLPKLTLIDIPTDSGNSSLLDVCYSEYSNEVVAVGKMNTVRYPASPRKTCGFYITAYTPGGSMLWEKTYNEIDSAYVGERVFALKNGGYIVAGTQNDGLQQRDYWLLKTDDNGEIIWEIRFGDSVSQWSVGVMECTDGSLLFAGVTLDGVIEIFKFTANGSLLFKKSIVRNDILYMDTRRIQKATDFGFILCSAKIERNELSPDGAYENLWLLRFDENGDTVWTTTIAEGYEQSSINSVMETSDGFVFAGSAYNFGELHSLFGKVGFDGNVKWLRPLVDSNVNNYEMSYSVAGAQQNAFYALLDSTDMARSVGMQLIKMDAATGDLLADVGIVNNRDSLGMRMTGITQCGDDGVYVASGYWTNPNFKSSEYFYERAVLLIINETNFARIKANHIVSSEMKNVVRSHYAFYTVAGRRMPERTGFVPAGILCARKYDIAKKIITLQ